MKNQKKERNGQSNHLSLADLRSDFSILQRTINGKALIYCDNAATTQKPKKVIDTIVDFYSQHNANVGRSIHTLGEEATTAYESARQIVTDFINARDSSEIVFTAGATDSINRVAHIVGSRMRAGDEIVISELEHHSNLIPWQQLAQEKGIVVRYIPVLDSGVLDLSNLDAIISQKTKLVSIAHVSNVFGVENDIEMVIDRAHTVGASVLVDACQSAPHQQLDVQKLDVDFLVFSGHKLLGPTGIGILYIKKALHDTLISYQVGGGMVYYADFCRSEFLPMPQLLEAGSPNIAGAIGLAAALQYLTCNVDFYQLRKYEAQLCSRLIDGLLKIERVRILGPIEQLRCAGHLVSFVIDGIHAHDVAAYLDTYGICVRAGHHCAQPMAQKMGILSSIRVSFYLYNTIDEVDAVLDAIGQLIRNF